MKQAAGKALAWAIAVLGFIITIAPLVRHGDPAIPLHHVFHAIGIAGGAALAVALMRKPRDTNEHGAWLVPAALAPLAMMFLMWPSTYQTLDQNPLLHVADHAALFLTGYVAVAAGQRYRAGTGIVLGVITVLMALTAAGGFGAYMGS